MDIYGIVESQRGALLAREYKTVKDILRAYEQAEGSVEKMIRAYQKKITKAKKAGLEPSLAWVYQEVRLENLLRELRMHLEEFSKDALEFTEKGKKNAYELGAVHALRLGEASVIGDFAGLNAGALQSGQFALSVGSPLKKLFDEIAPNATTAARKIFADSLALGWNPRKTGAVLKRKINELSKQRAQLIARTEMIRAYRQANTQVYKKNADVLRGWRWTAAKTPATCALCLGLDGEIYPVEETIKSHPACRCSMVPLPNTDFGGVQPTSGEEYFAKLPEKSQRKILGKRKTEMYRKGEISLKDNVVWQDHPEWGRSPKPRTLSGIAQAKSSGVLPSQTGSKLSTFQPMKPRSLSDLLTESERTSNDPIQKALKSWADAPKDKAGSKTTLKAVKTAEYKKYAPKKIADGVEGLVSEVSEVAFFDMTATIPYVSEAKVQAFIKAGGDGVDLPILVKQGEKLFIHDGDSIARLEAKKQLGQTKASVRIFDADQFKVETNPALAVEKELKDLGVQKIEVIDDTIDKEQALAWVKARIEATGHSPKSVLVGGGKTALGTDGELIVGRNFDSIGSVADKDQIADAVQDSWIGLVDTKVADKTFAAFKAARVQASTSVTENIEAVMIRQKIGVGNFYGGDGVKHLVTEFATDNYDLFSLKAFDGKDIVASAVEELIVLYRKGEYRLGSLPKWLEGDVISKLEKEFGKKTLLPAFEGEQKILGIQIGGQGGSNPGGMYLGRDGVKRYVKFYPQADRAEAEVLANAVYEALGIDVPKTTSFIHQGKTAFASEIIEDGKTIQQLGGVQNLHINHVEKVLDGYVADALLANWDVVGLSADNIMIAGSKVYRIDNGGTFIFRAQGGDKPDSLLQGFEELVSLGGKSSKGYVGQMNQFIKRLGGNDADAIVDRIEAQGKKTVAFLNGVTKGATTEADKLKKWVAWIDKTAPTMTPASKSRIAKMMVKRTQLLEDKLEAIVQARKPVKAAKVPKTLQAFMNTPEAKPLMRAGGSTAEYDKVLERVTDHAFDKMTAAQKASLRRYSGSEYNSVFNDPLRQKRKKGTPISSDSLKAITDVQKAMALNVDGLPEDALVFRRLYGSNTEAKWNEFDDKSVGTIISDSGFMSSSLNENVWSSVGDTQLRITMRKGENRFIPPGKRAKDGKYGGEHEFILGNDLLMLVKKVETKNGKKIIHVEVLPKDFKLPKGTVIQYARATVSRVRSLFSNEPKDLTPISENTTVHESGQVDEFGNVFRFSQCLSCESYARQGRCVAFPEGIPTEILTGAFDHRKPFRGDIGVRFSRGAVQFPSLNDDDTQSSREETLRYEESSDTGQTLLQP